MAESEQERKSLPVEWIVSDEIVTRYATNMVVQHNESEFIVQFFELKPPIILGPAEQRQEKLAQIESIKAHCVARVVVAAKRMKEFVDVLVRDLERFEKRASGESGE